MREAKKAGHAYVVVDATLIPAGRVAADRPFYSGKHQKHGMNLQVIAGPHGEILSGLHEGTFGLSRASQAGSKVRCLLSVARPGWHSMRSVATGR